MHSRNTGTNSGLRVGAIVVVESKPRVAVRHLLAMPFSAESYFATQPEPLTLEADIQGVSQFIDRQTENGRKVVLVTVNDPPYRQIHRLLQHD